jgi:hypothetical protein
MIIIQSRSSGVTRRSRFTLPLHLRGTWTLLERRLWTQRGKSSNRTLFYAQLEGTPHIPITTNSNTLWITPLPTHAAARGPRMAPPYAGNSAQTAWRMKTWSNNSRHISKIPHIGDPSQIAWTIGLHLKRTVGETHITHWGRGSRRFLWG